MYLAVLRAEPKMRSPKSRLRFSNRNCLPVQPRLANDWLHFLHVDIIPDPNAFERLVESLFLNRKTHQDTRLWRFQEKI